MNPPLEITEEMRLSMQATERSASEAFASLDQYRKQVLSDNINPMGDSPESKAAFAKMDGLAVEYDQAATRAADARRAAGLLTGLDAGTGLPAGADLGGDAGAAIANHFATNIRAAFDSSGTILSPPFMTSYFNRIQRRRTSILQIIPSSRVEGLGGESLDYLRQDASATDAAVTAHLGTKPTSTISVSRQTTTLYTLAHVTERIPLQLLTAFADLESFINNEMSRGVVEAAEQLVVTGSGSGQPEGILNTSGIGTQARGGDSVSDCIRKGITQLQLLDVEADALVLSPTDYEALELETDGQGAYLLGGPGGSEPAVLWRTKVISSTALSAGTAILGAFGLAARWWEGDGAFKWSENDGTDFSANALKARAELGFAFAVGRPSYFIQLTGL